MWPALIAAGASLIGSKMASDSAEKQSDIQREFAQSGIQWKVADAKAAGVHPLFALGASPASYSPVVSQAPQMIADAGQNISRAAMASQQADAQAEVQAAQIRASDASAMKDLAQSQYYASLAARSQQDGTASTSMPPAIPIPVYRSYGGDSLELQGFREPIAGQAVGRAVGSVAPRSAEFVQKPNEILYGSKSNMGIAAGPGDPGLKRFYLPFTIPYATEFGQSDYQAAVLLPSASNAGSAEAIEALEGRGTGSAIAAINIAYYGEDMWNLMKEQWAKAQGKSRTLDRSVAERLGFKFGPRQSWRGSGRSTGR